MIDSIQYIVGFLLGEDVSEEILSQVGYTNDPKEYHRYKLVIKPSNFFNTEIYGTLKSIPTIPLQIWEEAPILFGSPTVEEVDGTRILHADLVASTFFLISRYEEIVKDDVRDVHGRFPGTESLPYKAGFIDSPLVDEYSKLLRIQLRETGCEVQEPPKQIRKIYLTHDVDQLSHYRSLRGFMGGILRGLRWPKEGNTAIKSYFGGLRNDPWYTMPWLIKLDNSVRQVLGNDRCEPIVFIKVGGGSRKEDKPFITHHIQDFQSLLNLLRKKNIIIGLHSSYEAGINPGRIADEKKHLERVSKRTTTYNRHHYLDTREPQDMQTLIDVGITDDFTLGYADVAGFRLGTCRPVKWINPNTRHLTPLTLHPLTIMDSTLSDKRYMYMNSHDAYEYCIRLINMVESWNGELVLLWHNTSVEDIPQSYHRKLYQDIIKYLKTSKLVDSEEEE
ncbi:MAG: polysaccharide deacetylase family protein [Paludibacter sp.]|nr:polysaccharide deacetylase family protein [Paludibacter sp.]